MSVDEPEDYVLACQECQGGISRLQYTTYITWLLDELIAVPNFPTWVCDLCGWREFDTRAMTWLITLLNPPRRRASGHRARRWKHDEGEGTGESPQPIPK